MNEQDLYIAAMERQDPNERRRFLDEACGVATPLRQRVDKLIQHSAQVGSFLESPAPAVAALVTSPAAVFSPHAGSPMATNGLESGVLGDFRILEEIGRGGMGVVYEAEQISLRRRVALKVLLFASALDKTQFKRFRNEALAAASLEHPHVVPVHSVGTERGVHYYAMQYIDGQTLAQAIAVEQRRRSVTGNFMGDARQPTSRNQSMEERGIDGGQLPSAHEASKDTAKAIGTTATPPGHGSERNRIRDAVRLTIQAAEALEHAHRMGIVHRDIKPSNLMVDDKQHLWVADFGLAMVESEGNLTTSGGMLGTLRYMSPEQMRGDRHVLDHHTDIYSLGATLYELLALQPAFSDTDVTRLMRRIADDEPAAPRKLNPAVPRDLETIVTKAMAKDHEGRYATAGDMAADLERFLDNQPIRAKPPNIVERGRKWARRHRAVVATAAVTLMVAVAVGGFLLWRERSETLAALERETNHRRIATQQRRIALAQEEFAKEQMALADRRFLEAVEQQEVAEQATRQLREQLYVSNMKHASDAFRIGDLPRVRELLDLHQVSDGPPDPRGFEWYYLRKATSHPPVAVFSDAGRVRSIRHSDDGNLFATAFRDGRVQVQRVATFAEEASFLAEDESNGVAWSPDGSRIAVARADGKVAVWKWKSGLRAFLVEAHRGEANDVLFSRDGLHLFTCGDDNWIRIWDASTGAAESGLAGHEREVEELAVSPDGRLLASGSSDNTVRLWNWEKQEQLAVWSHGNGRVVCVAFSPQGRHVVGGAISGHLILADVSDYESKVLARDTDGIESVAFMPDGRSIVTGDRGGSIRLWSTAAAVLNPRRPSPGEKPRWIASPNSVEALSVGPNGQIVSGARQGGIAAWKADLATRWDFDGIREFAVGPQGKLYLAGQEIHVCNMPRRDVTASFLPSPSAWKEVAISANGQRLVAGVGSTVAVFDLDEHCVVWRREIQGAIHSVAVSPQGRFVAVGQYDSQRPVELFDVLHPEWHRDLPAPQMTRMAFAPGGNLLAIGSMDDVLVYRCNEPALATTLRGHSSTLADLVFSHDGRCLATVSHDRRLAIWNLETYQEVYDVRAHSNEIYAVAYSSDDRVIATGGKDRVIKLWHAATGQPLLEMPAEQHDIDRLEFHPGGKHLICRLSTGKLRVYDASETILDEGRGARTAAAIAAPNREPRDRAQAAEFRPIGPAPGDGTDCLPTGMSSDGSDIVGVVRSRSIDGLFHWCPEAGTTELAVPPGVIQSGPRVSRDGRTIVALIDTPKGERIACWTDPTEPPRLKQPNPSTDLVLASTEASSSDGSWIVGVCKPGGVSCSAYRCNGIDVEVLPIPRDRTQAMAKAITEDGKLIYGAAWKGSSAFNAPDASGLKPVRWCGGHCEELPGFEDEGYNWLLRDVSSDGQVIVGDRWPQGATGPWVPLGSPPSGVAFRWRSGQAAIIGELPGGYIQSTAEAVSDDGRIVVGGSHVGERTEAWIWDEQHGMRAIASVLREHGVRVRERRLASGGFLSADGQTIVGWGPAPCGHSATWLARIPRPQSRPANPQNSPGPPKVR